MNQWFTPPRPSGRRYKIMLWGESGTLKTKSALEFPKCAYLDNHGSAENYQADYPDHVFFPPPGILPNFDNTKAAVLALLQDPGDRLTCVIDDETTVWDQIQAKWAKLFLSRLPKSKGHHAEFYTLQPNDWIHPKRENRSFIRYLLAMDMNAIVIARAKKEYAGTTGDADFMKVMGSIFAGEPNLVYEFDYIFHLIKDADGKFWAEISQKQRVPAGGKPFPERFEFGIDKHGKSTFFKVFCKYANVERFSTPAHAVEELGKEEFPVEDSPAPEEIAGGNGGNGGGVAMAEAVTNIASPPIIEPTQDLGEEAVPPVQMITTEQLDRLKEIKEKDKIEKEEWSQTLEKFYGAKTAKALTQEMAEHFINYLQTQRVPF